MAWAARRGPARRAGNNSNPMGAFAPRLGLVNALSIPRGATRSGLPAYGLSEVLRLAPADRHGLLLLEGLIDVHKLRSDGFPNVAAVGGARAIQRSHETPSAGLRAVVLAFDNDAPGREGASRAVEAISRSSDAPSLRVVAPELLADAKDPDGFVQAHGMTRFRAIVDEAECAIGRRARELIRGITPDDPARDRRAALACAGESLGLCLLATPWSRNTPFVTLPTTAATREQRSNAPSVGVFWDRSENRGRIRVSIER